MAQPHKSLPVAMIADSKGGSISIDKLLAAKNVTCVSLEKTYSITGFTMTIYRSKDKLTSIKSDSNQMNDEMQIYLKKCVTGDEVYFEYIICKDAQGNDQRIAALKFTID
jgi:hypothetical protein